MGIQYDLNTLRLWLEKDEPNAPVELKEAIYKDLQYLQLQSRSLHSRNKEILLIETVQGTIKKFIEYPMMVDGRINTNDQPF